MTRRRLRVALAHLLAVALVVSVSGCIGLPQSGPVVDADLADEQNEDPASSIDPRRPQPGASRIEVVNGFLEAMMAWPISTSVAKEYLTDDAADRWSPGATVIYSRLAPAREDGSTVMIRMRDAAALDEAGAWRGPLTAGRGLLRFRLTIEDGEFRILDPIDALVVRSTWFQDRYRPASLYFFDPTAQVLVPEPVFVPVGRTFATNLVEALLAGPPARLRDVVRSFVPDGLTVDLSVPVEDGVAILDLNGDAPSMGAAETELMLAQLGATLGQAPLISALRVTIGGEQVDVPGVSPEYDIAAADAFDPADTGSTGVLYGLRRGLLVTGSSSGELAAVNGPLGRDSYDLASFAVAPGRNRVAAVTGSGQVLVGPLRSRDNGPGVRTLPVDGTGFTRPTWDASGRLWLLDRGGRGARLLVADGGGIREIDVDGVTGTDARRILVSRDGTRLVALVGSDEGDRLVAVRIVIGRLGAVERTVDSSVIWSVRDATATDLVWSEPAQVAVLTPAGPGDLSEIETVAADGATVGVDTLSSMLAGRVLGLAGESYAETPIYAITRDALIDVRTGERVPTVTRARAIDYAG